MNRSMLLLRSFRRNNIRTFSSHNTEINENEPIKFSTSRAATRGAIKPILNVRNNVPWYQPYCVVGSVAVFLLYFCVFREENDIDIELNKTLYDRVKGMEKVQLLLSYKYNKEHGLSVEEIENRLKEIEEEEAKSLAETQ